MSLATMDVSATEAPGVLDAYLDRNYYTTEDVARLAVSIHRVASNVQADDLKLSVSLVDEGGPVIMTREVEAALAAAASEPVTEELPPSAHVSIVEATVESQVELPIQDLPPGRHRVHLRLVDSSGGLVGELDLPLLKHPPAAEGTTEVKVDQVNQVLLLNGEPFFPLGMVSLEMDAVALNLYREAGFNTVIRWWKMGSGHPISSALETLDEARRNGIYVVENPVSFTASERKLLYRSPTFVQDFRKVLGEVPEFIRAVRGHPSVIAYYGPDEPHQPWDESPELLETFYDTVHGLDPHHPVYISGSRRIDPGWYRIADVLGVHVYWSPVVGVIPAYDYMNHRPNYMARCAEAARRITEPRRQPLLMMPQGELYSGARRPHTPRERRLNVYLALIHGAKSILYFASPIRHRVTYEDMKTLSAELHAMAPSLLTRTPPQRIVVEPAPLPPEAFPVVQALYKDCPDGGGLLLAANSSPLAVMARWDLSATGRTARVTGFSDDRELEVRDGVFSDRLEGYATRAYRVSEAARKPGTRVDIRVSLSGEGVEAAPDTVEGPGPSKNLLANSSFEEAALPGWPDCWELSRGALLPTAMVGDPGAPGQDDTTVQHGRYSLRILGAADRGASARITYKHPYPRAKRRHPGLPVERGRTYVLSAYLRAEHPGTRARLDVENFHGQGRFQDEVELTADWERHQLVCAIPESGEGRDWSSVWIRLANLGTGAIWVDAVQLEAGGRATEYAPDGYRAAFSLGYAE
ncbi:MAG: hypothetical protein QGI83_07900 [Candidatus Latescibacteria bacterium]|nr:hypothetical protein [Candidatus Latescibacterota bacterium]